MKWAVDPTIDDSRTGRPTTEVIAEHPVQDPPPRPTRRQPSPTTGGVATSPGNVRRRPATPRARAAAKPAIVTGRPPARGALVCRHHQLLLRARCRSLKRGPSSLEPPHNLDRGTLQDRLRQCGPQGFVQLLASTGLRQRHLEEMARTFASGLGDTALNISKRRGGSRTVLRPASEFDSTLKLLRRGIDRLSTYHPLPCVHGFVKGRGIVSNASMHLAKSVVLRIDIAGFFDSIKESQVSAALQDKGFDYACASLITSCVVVDNSLPAGFSTSPTLSNHVFDATDRLVSTFGARLG